MRILVVEDEVDIADALKVALERDGYVVDLAYDGTKGLSLGVQNSYGIIVLDWMLPGRSGVEICKSLRSMQVATPILLLTAKDDVPDRVAGLDAGADDYLVKPFHLSELLARLRALGRREAKSKSAVLEFGPIKLDRKANIASLDGNPITLTHREFDLLEALMRNSGRVLSRDSILTNVFQNDEALPNTVNFHMSSLRKKIDPEGKFIQTVHGFGYVLKTKETS